MATATDITQQALAAAIDHLILEFATSFDGRVRYMQHVIAQEASTCTDPCKLAALAVDAVRALDRKFDEDDETTEEGQ